MTFLSSLLGQDVASSSQRKLLIPGKRGYAVRRKAEDNVFHSEPHGAYPLRYAAYLSGYAPLTYTIARFGLIRMTTDDPRHQPAQV